MFSSPIKSNLLRHLAIDCCSAKSHVNALSGSFYVRMQLMQLPFLFFLSAGQPVAIITNSSVAYVTGFVVKALEEHRKCSACPALHETATPSSNFVALISLQNRGAGLTFQWPELVALLANSEESCRHSCASRCKANVTKGTNRAYFAFLKRAPSNLSSKGGSRHSHGEDNHRKIP